MKIISKKKMNVEEAMKIYQSSKEAGFHREADYGREKFYKFERYFLLYSCGEVFKSVEKVQEYVDNLLPIYNIFGKDPINIESTHARNARAIQFQRRIRLPFKHPLYKAGIRKYLILHELAHILTPGNGHGGEYRKALTFLLDQEMPEIIDVVNQQLKT